LISRRSGDLAFQNLVLWYFGYQKFKGSGIGAQDSRSFKTQNPEKAFKKDRHQDILVFSILRNREPKKCLHCNSLNHEKPVALERLGAWLLSAKSQYRVVKCFSVFLRSIFGETRHWRTHIQESQSPEVRKAKVETREIPNRKVPKSLQEISLH